MLQPLLQINTFPKSLDERGTLPEGYRVLNAFAERMVALPLMDARGLMSQDGVMYTSLCAPFSVIPGMKVS